MSAFDSDRLMAWPFARWAAKGAASIGEQGVSSLTAFVLQVVLLRFMGLEQYGAFSIAFSGLMLATAALGALTFEPMPIVAGRIDAGSMRPYIGQVVRYVGGIGLVLAFVVAVALLVSQPGANDLLGPMIAATLISPVIAVHWALRRGCYVLGNPGLGLISALSGAAVTLGLVWGGHRLDMLSSRSAFLVMAGAAVMASFVLCRTLSVSPLGRGALAMKDLVDRHRRYGVWMLGTAIAFWIMRNSLPPLATTFGGLEAAGAVRAYYNLILPLAQTIAALTAYATPIIARRFHAEGRAVLPRYNRLLTSVFCGIALLYCGALWIGGPFIVDALYAGEGRSFLFILPAFAVIGFLHASLQGGGVILTATGRTDWTFYAQATAAVFTVATVLLLGYFFGLAGVVWAFVVGNVVLWLGVMFAAFLAGRGG